MLMWAGVVSAVLVLSGCGEGAPEVLVAERESLLPHLPPEAVIVSVNGETLTRHQFDVAQSLYATVFRMRKPSRSVEECRRMAQAQAENIVTDFIRSALLRQEAARRGIEPDAEVLAATTKRMLGTLQRRRGTLEGVAKEIGGEEGALFCDIVTGDALGVTLRTAVGGDRLTVTDEDVDAEQVWIAAFNERAVATNAVNLARATALVQELRGGGDFAAAAAAYSDVIPEQGTDWWAERFLEDTEPPALAAWLKTAAEGDVSDPIEMEDGLAIVKALAIEREYDDDTLTLYRLARITFYIFETIEIIPREALREVLADERMKAVHRELAKRLHDEAVIEWPSGTDLFKELAPSQPRRVPRREAGN